MIDQLFVLLICFISLASSQSSTINKACGTDNSVCAAGQICVNGRCECDPNQRRFWAGEKYQCRVCPPSYTRLPTRCYKFYPILKNQSAARADCRRDQADLFSWRDNSDETELVTALTADWMANRPGIVDQTYSWSGGIVNHGRGTKADYKITWFDSKGPAILHPEYNDPYVARFCNSMMITNYEGDAEPTRQKKNGQTENCVTFVFLPRLFTRGQICMADDYCSIEMTYICELTEATIAGLYATVPPSVPDTDVDPEEPIDPDFVDPETTETPAALSDGNNRTSILLYIIGLITIFIIFGIVAFIVIRRRKQKSEIMEVTPTNSIANSNTSDI